MEKLAVMACHGFGQPYAVEMHRQAVLMTGIQNPRVLLIPLASNDNEGYEREFNGVYHHALGCETEVLHLFDEPQPPDGWCEMLDRAQMIFLGGGGNYGAIVQMKKQGVADYIAQLFHKGTVVAGEGIGAGFLFEGSFVGSYFGIGIETPIVLTVQGIGLARGVLCTGINDSEMEEGFASAIAGGHNTGLGLMNGTALFIEDKHYWTLDFEEHERCLVRLSPYAEFAEEMDVSAKQACSVRQLYGIDSNEISLHDYERNRKQRL